MASSISKRLDIMARNADDIVNKIKIKGETFTQIYYEVDGDLISVTKNEKYMYIEMCTCKHCSTHFATAELKGRMPLCKRKMALNKFL